MKPGIECERVLCSDRVARRRISGDENQIPTICRNDAGNDQKWMPYEQVIAKFLLTGAWETRPKPIGIGDRCGFYDMNGGCVAYRD